MTQNKKKFYRLLFLLYYPLLVMCGKRASICFFLSVRSKQNEIKTNLLFLFYFPWFSDFFSAIFIIFPSFFDYSADSHFYFYTHSPTHTNTQLLFFLDINNKS